jgi:hypothetical protein
LVAAAAVEIASHGAKEALRPVCNYLSDIIPFLAQAPNAFLFGLSFILVYYAKGGFCNAEIQEWIFQTLQWNNSQWKSR